MVATKVFVGNLSFKTTDRDLSSVFEVAGKVENANIITRGQRSLGYAFVLMSTPEEAEKAVQLLHKKEIDGREINVEVARPREEKPPAPEGSAPAPAAEGGDAAPRRGRGGRGGRGARGGRGGRGGRGPRNGDASGSPVVGGENAAGSGSPKPAGANAAARPPRQPRAPRAPRNTEPRTPSQTVLYVANLPFTVDDKGLAEIFAGFSIKEAHVVKKQNGDRSKGFGFVQLENQEQQTAALNAVSQKEVEGRKLVVKVAHTEIPKAAATGSAPGSPAPAPAPASPAPEQK